MLGLCATYPTSREHHTQRERKPASGSREQRSNLLPTIIDHRPSTIDELTTGHWLPNVLCAVDPGGPSTRRPCGSLVCSARLTLNIQLESSRSSQNQWRWSRCRR